jgi:hypothetical protein
MNCLFPYFGNVIIPSDELIFFRGNETTNQICLSPSKQVCIRLICTRQFHPIVTRFFLFGDPVELHGLMPPKKTKEETSCNVSVSLDIESSHI